MGVAKSVNREMKDAHFFDAFGSVKAGSEAPGFIFII